MSFDLPLTKSILAMHGPLVRVVVAEIKGSTPRNIGASMLVWGNGQTGTIGGGELEWQACKHAHDLILSGSKHRLDRISLGPSIGQCCGGAVTLVSEVISTDHIETIEKTGLFFRPLKAGAEMPISITRLLNNARNQGIAPTTCLLDGWMIEPVLPALTPLWIYGAGHVGRAIVDVITNLPDFVITWIDTAPDRFPNEVPVGVNAMPTQHPERALLSAPMNAHHFVLTYSHALDLELCHAGLNHGFSSFGLIGSATKWARFRKRLSALGHQDHEIRRITCPIGDPTLGKHPTSIAIGVAAKLIKTIQNCDAETRDDQEKKHG